MKLYKYALHYIGLAPLLLGLPSCGEMDATYKDLIRDGEMVYVGRTDSVWAAPGRERLRLHWQLPADPQIQTVRIFWNGRSDSLEVPVTTTGSPQHMSVLIENIEEGDYVFELVTYDGDGNTSVTTETLGETFGAQYESALVNRPADGIELTGGEGFVIWKNTIGEVAGTELIFENTEGTTMKHIVPVQEDTTVLSGIRKGSQLRFRTFALPHPEAIDTFYTAYRSMDVPLYAQVDKSKFSPYLLEGDNATAYSAATRMEKIWDGKLANTTYLNAYVTVTNSGVPSSFTFDMGKEAQLHHFRYHQRHEQAATTWTGGNPRLFEVYGSAGVPDPDGSWDGWTKLMDVESVKPSGLPAGENTEEDLALLLLGEVFTFPEGLPPVRYIRVKVNETWGKTQTYNIGELTFYE